MVRRENEADAVRSLGAFIREERGGIAIMAAAVLVTTLIGVGVSTDLMRAYLTRNRLANSLDSAALAAGGSTGSAAQLQSVAGSYLNANFAASNGVTLDTPTVDLSGNPVTMSATAHVPTAFLQIAGIDSIAVSASTAVQHEYRGLEVALVLDNTGSLMYPYSGAAGSNMAAIKKAAGQLVMKLFGAKSVTDTATATTVNNPNLRVALVPYTASVNPVPVVIPNGSMTSAQFAAALTQSGTKPSYIPPYYTYSKPSADYGSQSGSDADKWLGCVEESAAFKGLGSSPSTSSARSALDTSWTSSGGAFTPYYWRAEVTDTSKTNNGKCDLASDHTTIVSNGVCNLWTTGGSPNSSVTQLPWSWGVNTIYGPNRSCPTPVTPLDSNMADLVTAIGLNSDGSANTAKGMGAWNNGGTMGSLGVAWGYRILSPNGPYASISTVNPWNTDKWRKVLVLMTDGVNQFNQNQYTGYGPYQSGFGSGMVDAQEKAVCDVLRSDGVTIYSVFFSSNSTPGPAISYCAGTQPGAGDPNYYFNAADQSQLLSAFQTIGQQLSNLRVIK